VPSFLGVASLFLPTGSA